MPINLSDLEDDRRASESDREYLDAVEETRSGGVDPDEEDEENDDCLSKLFGLVIGGAIIIQTILQRFM